MGYKKQIVVPQTVYLAPKSPSRVLAVFYPLLTRHFPTSAPQAHKLRVYEAELCVVVHKPSLLEFSHNEQYHHLPSFSN